MVFHFLKLKKGIALGFCIIALLIILFTCFVNSLIVSVPMNVKTIAIDAGHGGIDGGCVGNSGITESELNLDYANCLAKICKQLGFNVVLTRENMNGLYEPFASNKKLSEMKKRQDIILKNNADLVISLHMNSINIDYVLGAQVFYQEGDEVSKKFAQITSNSLCDGGIDMLSKEKEGDFYLLNTSKMPAILIECGFLSNIDEEKRLLDEEYKNKFCKNLSVGIVKFFSE